MLSELEDGLNREMGGNLVALSEEIILLKFEQLSFCEVYGQWIVEKLSILRF